MHEEIVLGEIEELKTALERLEELKRGCLSKLPGRDTYFHQSIEEGMNATARYIRLIYVNEMKVGEGFNALSGCMVKPGYQFWIQGIHRHIDICKKSIEELSSSR